MGQPCKNLSGEFEFSLRLSAVNSAKTCLTYFQFDSLDDDGDTYSENTDGFYDFAARYWTEVRVKTTQRSKIFFLRFYARLITDSFCTTELSLAK